MDRKNVSFHIFSCIILNHRDELEFIIILLVSVNASNASCTPMSGHWETMRQKVVEDSLLLISWKALASNMQGPSWRCMEQISPCPISRKMDSLLRCCLRKRLDWD